jgi:hypothetical protein
MAAAQIAEGKRSTQYRPVLVDGGRVLVIV